MPEEQSSKSVALAVIAGGVAGVAAQLFASAALLVSVGVFGADPASISGDPETFIKSGVAALIWGAIAGWVWSRARARVAALVSYVTLCALVGLGAFGLSQWWWLSVAIAISGLLTGTALGRLAHRWWARRHAPSAPPK